MEGDKRIPVSVVTGFLGAGKTTLLNHILTQEHGRKIAVIENEFGEVGIDDALVLSTDEEIFEMNNGCVCCTVRGDLIRVLGNLGKRKNKFDMILLETTGMADPGPVIQTFFMDDQVKEQYRIDSVITLVDSKHVIQHLDEKKPHGAVNESVQQIAFADRVILNKIDLVTQEELGQVKNRIRAINAYCVMYETERSKIDLDKILGLRSFDLEKILADNPTFLEEQNENHEHDHEHHEHSHEHKKDKAKKEGKEKTKNKDKKKKHSHHDAQVTSVGIVCDKPLDFQKVNSWLRQLLTEKGQWLFRTKGILYCAGQDNAFVFQGVHMLLDSSQGRPWQEGEKRESKLVFIGKDLDRAELTAAFNHCLA